MYQRDYLKKQMDQFTQALVQLLSDLLKLKKEGNVEAYLPVTDQLLKNERNLEIQQLIDIPMPAFMDVLQKKNFSNESLDKLADIFFIVADIKKTKEKTELYKKCLLIFDHLEKTEKNYSLDWDFKRQNIRKFLSEKPE